MKVIFIGDIVGKGARETFVNKIHVYEEAAVQARRSNMSSTLLSNSDSKFVRGESSLNSSTSSNIYLEKYKVKDVIPLIALGYESIEMQVNFFKRELAAVLKALDEKKYHEIFSLHGEYTSINGNSKTTNLSREVKLRKNELKELTNTLAMSSIARGVSPIIDVSYENIYYYDTKNKLKIPFLSIIIFGVFFIFALFFSFFKFKK